MARALATKPRLLLADESLGGLDENEMAAAADMLKRIRDERGVTIIWVEHIMGVLMKVQDNTIKRLPMMALPNPPPSLSGPGVF